MAFAAAAGAADSSDAQASRPIWPMYRGDAQRSGYTGFKGPVGMRVKWELDLHREIVASPAIAADGAIYLGAGALFYAVTPDGRVAWSHNFADSGQAKPPKRDNATSDSSGFTSPSPALGSDGTIFQDGGMNSQSYIMALDPRPNAPQRIRRTLSNTTEMRSSPLVAGAGCLVADSQKRFLLALSGDGKVRWQSSTQPPLYASGSSPALSADEKTVYVGGLDGRLHAFSAETGEPLWTAGADERAHLRLPAWDAEGRQIAHFTTRGHVPESPAVGGDGAIYFGSWDGRLYAVEPAGRLRWSIDLKDRVSSAPAVSPGGYVLVCTYDGSLCAVRTVNGQPVLEWQVQANDRYSAPLITSDGKVYVGSLDGKLRAYALADGRLLDELAVGRGWIHASPVPGADGLLYLGSSDGFLRAIESGSPRPLAKDPSAAPVATTSPSASIPHSIASTSDGASASRPADYADALRIAHACMEETDAARRAVLIAQAGDWSERLDDLALALRPVPPAEAPRGFLPEDRFQVPRVRARMAALRPKPEGPVLPFHPPKGSKLPGALPDEEHLNWVYVPENYDPKKPLGLVISLHGGAGSVPQDEARPLQQSDYWGAGLMHTGDFISVCPSTPPQLPSKFAFPESEIHFQSLIEEYSTRYAIDPNRIYLTGFSMGGIGSWWEAFRQADRFAVIAPRAGRWTTAYWPKLRGTLLCSMNGAFDFELHVNLTRFAHDQMNAQGIPHIDMEYPGAHSTPCSTEQMTALFDLFRQLRRDPYCRHVCAVSPYVIEGAPERYPPQPYSFWASVVEAGPDGIPVDSRTLDPTRSYEGGTDGAKAWSRQRVTAGRKLLNGAGAVDALNLGGNHFRVTVTNVKRFRLWLHPGMDVDFAKPIEIELIHNTVDPFALTETPGPHETVVATAKPSLGSMLRYLSDRRDFGLIYHAMIEVEVH